MADAVSPSRLAQLFAQREGFYVAGSLPQRSNNPGDLRHAAGETHPADAPDSVGSFATPQQGWDALQRQLELFAERGLTLDEAVYTYAPPSENNSEAYLQFMCAELGCTPDTPISQLIGET